MHLIYMDIFLVCFHFYFIFYFKTCLMPENTLVPEKDSQLQTIKKC